MPVLLRRVTLRNFKSIALCKVDLRDLSLLVGPNGVGKSNFVDALRLVSDSLGSTLEYAIRQRGGIGEVRRRSGGHPNHFNISLRVKISEEIDAAFAFQIGALPNGGFHVQQEQASVVKSGIEPSFYVVKDGEVTRYSSDLSSLPSVFADRLFLTAVSGLKPFRQLFDALSSMGFYNINPVAIREPQVHDKGDVLRRDGGNIAAVIRRIGQEDRRIYERIQQYLRQIVPGVEGVEYKSLGPRETIEFRQAVQNSKHAWRFYAAAMSDGTLRSLGVLTALFQFLGRGRPPTPLIAIEEPESTIHPGAASTIMDALIEASTNEQILATTHSPDLLDHPGIRSENVLAVKNIGGETLIAPVDEASRSAIRDELYTPGELLRTNQLQPDPKLQSPQVSQADLFQRLD